MVKQRLADQLDLWLDACETFSAMQVQNFASSLRQDYAAVRAALETIWSNGQTEGQVNRLKCIKRQMYGRANFDLLRLKVLYPLVSHNVRKNPKSGQVQQVWGRAIAYQIFTDIRP